MASLDDIVLFSPGRKMAGAAFLLNETAKADLKVEMEDGWIVETRKGSHYVVGRCDSSVSCYEEAAAIGFNKVQKGLDFWSVERSGDYSTSNAKDEHLVWWYDYSGQVLRTKHTAEISPEMKMTVVVRDANGKEIPPPMPNKSREWDESLRYFRLAQVSDDLFDSCRNLYLALECILDRIAPQHSGKPNETENDWFPRALTEANKIVSLESFVRKGCQEPIKELQRLLYTKTRLELFHAKRSRPLKVPHQSDTEYKFILEMA